MRNEYAALAAIFRAFFDLAVVSVFCHLLRQDCGRRTTNLSQTLIHSQHCCWVVWFARGGLIEGLYSDGEWVRQVCLVAAGRDFFVSGYVFALVCPGWLGWS